MLQGLKFELNELFKFKRFVYLNRNKLEILYQIEFDFKFKNLCSYNWNVIQKFSGYFILNPKYYLKLLLKI